MNSVRINKSATPYVVSESGGIGRSLKLNTVLITLSLMLIMGFADQEVLAQLCPCAQGETRRGFAPFNGCPAGGNLPAVNVCNGPNGTVTVQCINGAFQVKWNPVGGGAMKNIGRCAYDWGENDGQCCIDAAGNVTRVCWWNQEGHHGHGRDPGNPLNGHVHDDTTHGQCAGEYEMDCYEFNVAPMTLKTIKWKRPIDPETWLEQECWLRPSQSSPIYDGPAPETHSELVTLTMNGNSSAEGQDNAGNYVWARLTGIANSGSITLKIREQSFQLDLVGGETPDEVALALASMVNSFAPLTDEGVDAFVYLETTGEPTQLNVGRVQEQERSIQRQGQGQGGIEPEVPWWPSIPTVSEWGLIVMVVLVLTAGTIVLGRRRRGVVAA